MSLWSAFSIFIHAFFPHSTALRPPRPGRFSRSRHALFFPPPLCFSSYSASNPLFDPPFQNSFGVFSGLLPSCGKDLPPLLVMSQPPFAVENPQFRPPPTLAPIFFFSGMPPCHCSNLSPLFFLFWVCVFFVCFCSLEQDLRPLPSPFSPRLSERAAVRKRLESVWRPKDLLCYIRELGLALLSGSLAEATLGRERGVTKEKRLSRGG